MVRGGPFWRYITPIIGPPWASPIEMPLYQWIVATISKAGSLDLHATGRGVSVGFFLATLVSLWFALDLIDIRPRYRPVFMALTLVSPLYLFWSRTFMIESTALFFAITYLLAMHRATAQGVTSRQTMIWLTAALAAGALGGMVKVTTLVPWWTAAAILAATRLRRGRRARSRQAGVAVALVAPVLAAVGWLVFSDAVKAENPLSAQLAWSPVAWQHFGPLATRFSLRSWYAVPGGAILGRTRHTVVGSFAVFASAWLAIVMFRRRLAPALVCVALYLLPIAIFMRLYNAHVYYQYENSLLLILMVGCGIVALLERRDAAAWLGLALLTAALLAATTNYLRGYYVDQQSDDVSHWPLATSLERQVPTEDVLLIYGLDLDTEFTYAAQRRAIMSWEDRGAGDPLFERSLALLAQEPRRIGALVACGNSRGHAIIRSTAQRLAIALRPSYRDGFCDVYFPTDRMPATELTFQ
jgi:hypothetical protein